MYLDDILLIAPDYTSAQEGYELAISLLTELGLPLAIKKLTPLTRDLVWLSIRFDLDSKIHAIPDAKLEERRATILDALSGATVTTRQLQRVVGVINHLGKAVTPAHLFMSRLLQVLRGWGGKTITVDDNMRADIKWFETYLRGFNGHAIIPDTSPHKFIEADACPTGIGAHDGKKAYSVPVSYRMSTAHSISRLECLNCLLAVRTLTEDTDRGHTVVVKCDNEAAVFTYMYGRARDAVMSVCGRAMWMLAADKNINIVFMHVPGSQMNDADALSRVFNH